MSLVSASPRFTVKSSFGRLSVAALLAVGIATGSGVELAEAKSTEARADGKQSSGHVIASSSSSRKGDARKSRAGKSRSHRSAGKSRAKGGSGKSGGRARATGRKIG